MVQLCYLILAYLLGIAQTQELFSSDCCSKKNVGGVDYTQIPGDTTGFDNCKADCVYERDDTPGSRFCFSTGNTNTDMPAMCTESSSTRQKISVKRGSAELEFAIATTFDSQDVPVSFTCNIEPMQNASANDFKEIICNFSSIGPASTETANLISSFSSNGDLEWISLHLNPEWFHCTFLSTSILPSMNCSICTTCKGDFNRLYVEGAFAVNQNASLDEQLNECNTSCVNDSSCGFWTFSYFKPHHARKHNEKSECGRRSYDACCLIPTNIDQYYGFVKNLSAGPPGGKPAYPIPDPNPIKNKTAVWQVTKAGSDKQCHEMCSKTDECTTWTWDVDQDTTYTCSLNKYLPTRNINISFVDNPAPNLYSGCIDRGSFKCANVPASN